MTTSLPTYEERILRYRVCRREANLSLERQAQLRLNGIDPDNAWSLIWSFDDKEAADDKCAEEQALLDSHGYGHLYDYRVIDAGQATTVTRTAWL